MFHFYQGNLCPSLKHEKCIQVLNVTQRNLCSPLQKGTFGLFYPGLQFATQRYLCPRNKWNQWEFDSVCKNTTNVNDAYQENVKC